MPTLNLNPTDSYVLSNVDYTTWDKISDHPSWETNYLPITRGILLEMPPASVDPAKITAITLKVYDAYASEASNEIDIGFTTSISKPSSVKTCSVNVTEDTTEISFNVAPSVAVDDVWYIFLDSETTVNGLLDLVEIEYVTHTACGAPTTCKLGATTSTGSNVTLSWSGAKAGTDNAIKSYLVQRAESSDGSTWGSWETLQTVTTTATSGSLSVAPPTTAGNYYKYRVRTQGEAGSSYYSGYKESTNTLRRNWTACGAPTTCKVSSALATSNVTLSWSGATAGYGNAITKYEIQRCESTNGSTWGSWTALTTTTATSLSVAPPTTAGNYYKYRVRTQGTAGSSYYSGWKESTNTLRRDHAPLAGFTDSVLTAGTTPIKAIHMQELQNRVATLRTFYGLSAYKFTTIVSGQTSLAGWTAHVLEIRSAIDEVAAKKGVTHAAWLTITENKPRVNVMQQLRDVVLSL